MLLPSLACKVRAVRLQPSSEPTINDPAHLSDGSDGSDAACLSLLPVLCRAFT